MVKIIKEGKLPETEVRQHTCYSCKTVFQFTVGEAVRRSDQREGDRYEIVCPFCNKMCSQQVRH